MESEIFKLNCYAYYRIDKKDDGNYLCSFQVLSPDSPDDVPRESGLLRLNPIFSSPLEALAALVSKTKDFSGNTETWITINLSGDENNENEDFKQDFGPIELSSVPDIARSLFPRESEDAADQEDQEARGRIEYQSVCHLSYPIIALSPDKHQQEYIDKEQELSKKIESELKLSVSNDPEGWLQKMASNHGNDEGVLLETLIRKQLDRSIEKFKENPHQALHHETKRLLGLMKIVTELRFPNLCLHLAYSPVLLLLFFSENIRRPQQQQVGMLFNQLIEALASTPYLAKSNLDSFWAFIATKRSIYVTLDHVKSALAQLCIAHPEDLRPAVTVLSGWATSLGYNKKNQEELKEAWEVVKISAISPRKPLWEEAQELSDTIKNKASSFSRVHAWWKDLVRKTREETRLNKASQSEP